VVKPKLLMPDFTETSAIFAQHYSIIRELKKAVTKY